MENDENNKPGPSRQSRVIQKKGKEEFKRQIKEDWRNVNSSEIRSKWGNRSISSGAPRGRGSINITQNRDASISRTTNFRGAIQVLRAPRGRGSINITQNRDASVPRTTNFRGGFGSVLKGRDTSNRGNGNLGRSQEHRRNGYVGFLALKRIAESEERQVLKELSRSKVGFMNIVNSPINDGDIFVVVMEILAKLTQSPFEERKSKIIVDICNSNFITSLRNYLLDLPYTEVKRNNRFYWENEQKFWTNFILFCEDVVNSSVDTAARTCRVLIESVSKTCLEGLNQNHEFTLEDQNRLKLDEVRQKLTTYMNRRQAAARVINAGEAANEETLPPDNFQELSVVPTREDLLGAPPFLRPNITEGGYSDVLHYLDVQFRLLREDCYGPIRVGIEQYLANPTKRKFDHVRVHRNVKFVGPYISNLKVGHLVQLDTGKNNYFKRTNWAYSKRFLFGSLVFLTKDRFRDCVMATILDRDNMLMSMGRIPVTVIDTSFGVEINSEDTYTMIESEVYFEPYHHVLRALQAPLFPLHMPMQEYIVKVNASSKLPAYVTDRTEFYIPIPKKNTAIDELTLEDKDEDDELISDILGSRNYNKIHFYVSKPESWPQREDLQFNTSQYEAYKLALTHEFAVIQGPPGTGKTYVGLKVAETLLSSVETDRYSHNNCVMLVVCYTNHALDQFLEGISKVTKHIVRIGSQSRNPAMDEYNLMNLRKNKDIYKPRMSSDLMEAKANLKETIKNFQENFALLDILNNGVVNTKYLYTIPEVKLLCNYYSRYDIKDPIMYWLFENHSQYNYDFNECIDEYQAITINSNDNEFNNKRMETIGDLIIKDDKDLIEYMKSLKEEYASFLLIEVKGKLKELVSRYLDNKTQSKDTSLIERDIQHLNSCVRLFDNMTNNRSRTVHVEINSRTDFSTITTQNRWNLYFTWISEKRRSLEKEIADFQSILSSAITSYEEARMMLDMELLQCKKIKVLGMTTSGAARMRKLIHAISPRIVIVEEAAEVLEQHIITSLPKTCQHLILIGDHQQLRPSASYIKLVKNFNIEVSLFERMITNGMHSRRLDVQHRMRPEIAALISPHIYPKLENHPSVECFNEVLGLEKSVFFFSHTFHIIRGRDK